MTSTISDVAAAAGVSRATASRALSGHPAVLPDTRERVLRVADELSYRADPVARALRAGQSNLIALVVTNLQNPAIQAVAEVIQTRGQQEGFDVVIATTTGDPERERRLVDALTGRRVDGLLVMSTDSGTSRLNALARAGLPVVELIRLPRDLEVASVVYDDREAGLVATDHLLALGHRRLAFIGGPVDTRSGQERYEGFADAHARHGVPVDDALVRRGPFASAFGSESVDGLDLGPGGASALVLANHEAMFAALQAVSRHGIEVPQQLSIVAIEDDPLLSWWHPAITVVDVRPEQLAGQAMDRLIAQIRHPKDTPTPSSETIDIELTLRDSTAPPSP